MMQGTPKRDRNHYGLLRPDIAALDDGAYPALRMPRSGPAPSSAAHW